MKRITHVLMSSLCLILFFNTGCRSSKIPAPTSELASARQAVAQAEQVGAERFAPLEIRNARQKLEEAQAYLKKKEHKKAKMMVEKAMVDAELAEARSLSAKAQKAVDELKETIETLREEIRRNGEN